MVRNKFTMFNLFISMFIAIEGLKDGYIVDHWYTLYDAWN